MALFIDIHTALERHEADWMTLLIFWGSYELITCYRLLALPRCTLGINILVISPSIMVSVNLKLPLVYFTEPIRRAIGGPVHRPAAVWLTLRTFLHWIIGLKQQDKVNAACKFHSELPVTERSGIQEYFHAKLELKNTSLWSWREAQIIVCFSCRDRLLLAIWVLLHFIELNQMRWKSTVGNRAIEMINMLQSRVCMCEREINTIK